MISVPASVSNGISPTVMFFVSLKLGPGITDSAIQPGEDIVFLAMDINLLAAVDWMMMRSCFSFLFMLVLEKQEKCGGHWLFFIIVQLIRTCR